GGAVARRRIEDGAAELEHRLEHRADGLVVFVARRRAKGRRAAEPDDRQFLSRGRDRTRDQTALRLCAREARGERQRGAGLTGEGKAFASGHHRLILQRSTSSRQSSTKRKSEVSRRARRLLSFSRRLEEKIRLLAGPA